MPNWWGDVPRYSSGCTVLDCCLGGGWPLYRVANIVGDRSTGKTLLAIEAAANYVRATGGQVLYLEGEAAFDITYARQVGLPDTVTVVPVATVEDFIAQMDKAAADTLVVLDSLDSLSDAAELETAPGSGYGLGKAKLLSQFFRRSTQRMAQQRITLLVISQVRENIGVVFGSKYRRAGGKALDFYASVVVWLAQGKKLERTVQGMRSVVGVEVTAKVEKNKVGLPFRKCTFPLLFGYGIDDLAASLIWLGQQQGDEPLAHKPGDTWKLLHSDSGMEEYRKLARRYARLVKAKWQQVEEAILPRWTKYGNGAGREAADNG